MRILRETESRVDFFKRGAGRNANERENELKDNKMNITIQNRLMNYVKKDIKNIIEGILSRYDNYIYNRQYKRFFKDNRTVLEKLKDKVNLAIACLSKYISKYVVNNNLDGHPHSLFIDGVKSGLLRRDERNSKKWRIVKWLKINIYR